jgi:virulence-associated protein VagC
MARPDCCYYYSNGHRVPLERDVTRVAVNTSTGPFVSEVRKVIGNAIPLPGGWVFIKRSRIPAGLMNRLTESGGVQPVFVEGKSTVVALPEVRVVVTKSSRRSVLNALEHSPVAASITEDSLDKLVVRPTSGSGDDALRLANHLAESKPTPRVAQARFLRISPRPEP